MLEMATWTLQQGCKRTCGHGGRLHTLSCPLLRDVRLRGLIEYYASAEWAESVTKLLSVTHARVPLVRP